MRNKKILYDLDFLRQKSSPVLTAEEALDIISKLKKVLMPIDNGIGLSAIQIGILKQVSIIKNTDWSGKQDGNIIYLINPEIITCEDEFIHYGEGCLSCPGIFKSTRRYDTFIIKNNVIRDNKLEEEIQYYYAGYKDKDGRDGLSAIAVQHEIDHLNGKVITDYGIESTPIKREEDKVGRNDPCPCGSGKKYKKCCGK